MERHGQQSNASRHGPSVHSAPESALGKSSSGYDSYVGPAYIVGNSLPYTQDSKTVHHHNKEGINKYAILSTSDLPGTTWI